MTYDIKVIPNAKHNAVSREASGFKVHLTAPATDGKANKALIELLAGHWHVKKRQILITKGLQSRHKTIRILGESQAPLLEEGKNARGEN